MTGRILLVEADVVLGAVLAEVLRHSGYEVIIVKTLQGKVEHIDCVSAVILDIDTTTAEHELAWLDAHRASDESLPIVLMGLQAPQELRHRLCVQLGLQRIDTLTLVQKPFRNEELLAAVRQAHARSSSAQVDGI